MNSSDDEKLFQVALTLISGIGDILIKQLISYCGSASNVFKTPFSRLIKIPGIGEKIARSIVKVDVLAKAEKELDQALKKNIRLLFFTDPNYPHRCKEIADAPVLFYWKGNVDINAQKTIAIVGTRSATKYGIQFLEEFISDLQSLQPIIISGLAYGIDASAHQLALRNKLNTIAVLANGLDSIYPSVHTSLAHQLINQGGLLTEYSFSTKPERQYFPARNRIIAGISDAILVVEAAEKGGALITASIANSYHKDVFALPGNFNQPFSYGCNYLIKSNQAHLLTNVNDLKEIMNWEENKIINKKEINFSPSLCKEEIAILTLLQNHENEIHVDDISWKSQIPIYKLSSFLLNLELTGLIKLMPGKKYKLCEK